MMKRTVVTEDYKETLDFIENPNGTYSLNFKKMPALVFVSYDGSGTYDQLFVHGEYKQEAQRITIESEVRELTKYSIDSLAVLKMETISNGNKVTLHAGETIIPCGFTEKDELDYLMEPTGDVPLTHPQDIRDETIEEAKRDVAELSFDGNVYLTLTSSSGATCDVEYVINKEKRSIVVLLRGVATRKIRARGIAKADPSDCFNAHIGKAIALRRALGLEVPAEYLNAPQPTEVRVGDVVELNMSEIGGTSGIVQRKVVEDSPIPWQYFGNVCALTSPIAKNGKVIDDSREEVAD